MRSPVLVAIMESPRASHLTFDVVSAAVQEVFNKAVARKVSGILAFSIRTINSMLF